MTELAQRFKQTKQEHDLVCSYTPPQAQRSKTALGQCTLHGHRVVLYRQKEGTISAYHLPKGTLMTDTKAERIGVKAVEEAFVYANRFLVETATRELRGVHVQTDFSHLREADATIRDAFDFIRANLTEHYTEKQWREILRILLIAEKIWGVDQQYLSLSGSDINEYIMVRTGLGIELPREFSRRPRLGPCKLATAVNDLLMLATVFKKIQGESLPGSTEKPFRVNPFSWLTLPNAEKALREKPTAERFEILMNFVDRVDATGRLRLALVLARRHGRRIGAISALRVRDLRLTVPEMLETLRHIARIGHQPQDGIQGSDFAYAFQRGGVFYDGEHDKEGYRRLVPLCSRGRVEVERYLERNPKLDPSGPLLPSAQDPNKAVDVPELIQMLHDAEELAREEGFAKQVPVLYDSAFHGYRGLRATELDNMGHRKAHVRFIVGWTCKTGEVVATRYVLHSGELLYAAVEDLRPVEVDAEFQEAVRRVEEENAALRAQNTELLARIAAQNEHVAILMRQMERMEAQMDRMERQLVTPDLHGPNRRAAEPMLSAQDSTLAPLDGILSEASRVELGAAPGPALLEVTRSSLHPDPLGFAELRGG